MKLCETLLQDSKGLMADSIPNRGGVLGMNVGGPPLILYNGVIVKGMVRRTGQMPAVFVLSWSCSIFPICFIIYYFATYSRNII